MALWKNFSGEFFTFFYTTPCFLIPSPQLGVYKEWQTFGPTPAGQKLKAKYNIKQIILPHNVEIHLIKARVRKLRVQVLAACVTWEKLIL